MRQFGVAYIAQCAARKPRACINGVRGARAGRNPMNDVNSSALDTSTLKEKVVAAIRTCYDPEIPVNIYELGLIYDVKVDPAGVAAVRMTLTSPNCPSAQE